MPLVAMVCAGLLGWAAGSTLATKSTITAEYHQVKAAAGHSADDQVRLALWCEEHGLTAERMRHLTLAVLADPSHVVARSLAGLVARNGTWVAPEDVARTVRTDEATASLLAKYDLKRSATPYTAQAQMALANWADEHGLKDQARAHYTAVTRLDPHREAAWHHLGYKKIGGRWETEAEAQAARAEAEADRKADKLWIPILQKIKATLTHPGDHAAAQATLLGVTDSHAFHAIRAVFGHGGHPPDQVVAIQLLDQIDGGNATRGLADLAVHAHAPEIRASALDKLARRDPRDCLDSLVQQIRTPWNIEIRPITGPGSVGGLFVEGERFNLQRLYAPPGGPSIPGPGTPRHPAKPIDVSTPGKLQTYLNAEIAAANLQLARRALQQSIREVEDANAKINESNARVKAVLTRITGQTLDTDRQDWARWNTERLGFAYQSASVEKPTFTIIPQLDYQSPVVIPIPPRPHAACFAAGTLVRTIDGTKSIELVQPGDMVLVQNTTSGALSFAAVLVAAHNPPSPTYRVKTDGDQIVATGIHRFWRAGIGWTMARDLKAGDLLRVIGGVATVESVTPEATQLVYNLEVAEGKSFFVGRLGALVHDNSLVEPTSHPFDAPRTGATAIPAR